MEGLDIHDKLVEEHGEPIEDLISVSLVDGNPEHMIQIKSNLDQIMKDQLSSFLQANSDIFAWTPLDISKIDPLVIIHRLNVSPNYRPFMQKKRNFASE